MPFVSAFAVAREVLSEDLSMNVEEVVRRARNMAAEQPDAELRHAISCVRGLLKSLTNGNVKPGPAATATRHNRGVRPEPTIQQPHTTTEGPALSAVFANIVRVKTIVSACGGIEIVREVADAVRACGSVDAFLQHLDLVAEISTAEKAE